MTYKDIATMLGNENLCRVVGNALHVNPNHDLIPCHRVVNSKGSLANNYGLGGIEAQKEFLLNEGIEVTDYRVDLDKYRYKN